MIKDQSKGRIIAQESKYCTSISSKSLGLMFSFSVSKPLIFVFKREKIISLHMFFVFFPIDVIFLDKNKTVIEIKERFLPFTFYKTHFKAKYAIEMKSGLVRKTNIEIGDRIKF